MDYIKKQKNSKERKMEESNRRNGSRTNKNNVLLRKKEPDVN